MRTRSILIALWSLGFVGGIAWADDGPRRRLNFDADWKFHLGELPVAYEADFEDGGWRTLDVPHDFCIEQPHGKDNPSGNGFLPGGIGWYRKTFQAPDAWRGKRVEIQFDGVMRNSTVWINGHELGQRPYGYVGFHYDLSQDLKFDQPNVIAVRADKAIAADSRWYTGGGIYRHVWLVVTERTRFADGGIYITTPKIAADGAMVRVAYEFELDGKNSEKFTVESVIESPTGMTAATLMSPIEQDVLMLGVPNPKLWSPDSPVLYHLRSRLLYSGRSGEKVVDEVVTPFGIRSIRFDPDQGFFLNGENMLIKGVCIHHDVAAVGAAAPEAMWARRLKLLKAMGANAIRMSHNPMAPEIYDLCDELGFLVQDEMFDEWIIGKRKWVQGWNVGQAERFGYSNSFQEWSQRDVTDIVRQHRNHPSIIMWSIGNEIDFPDDPTVHPEGRYGYAEGKPRAELLVPEAKKLIAAVKAQDKSRPVTMALADIGASNATGLADLLDVVGYNYQEQYYDRDHAKYPQRVIYGSETNMWPNRWFDVRDKPFISGQFLWIAFAYLGEAREYPARGWLGGLFDFCGNELPIGEIRRVLWSNQPQVAIQVMQPRNGSDEQGRRRRPIFYRNWTLDVEPNTPLQVRVFANTDEAELFLNGRSLGVKQYKNSDNDAKQWEVAYQPGELKVVGRNADGKSAECVWQTFGAAERLVLKTEEKTLRADGADVLHVHVLIADKNGTRVQTSDAMIELEVSGPAKLIGFDNGNPRDVASTLTNQRQAFEGRTLAYLQSTGQPGTVRIRAKTDGLEAAELAVEAVEP